MSEDNFCNSLYGLVQEGGSCGWYVRNSHKMLEKGFVHPQDAVSVLEIGCNLGEHTEFVTHPYDRYIATDYRHVDFKPLNSRISFQVADAQNLPFEDDTFDRVIVTCVLHHLPEPEKALREMRRVTKGGGLVSLLVPTDPGLLYRVGKRIGPYRKIRRLDATLDPEYFHYLQHRNHFPGIVALIRRQFSHDVIRRFDWPIPWKFWNLNLYRVYQISIQKPQ